MRTKLKVEELDKAIKNFEDSINIDINLLPDIIKDSVESGRIQKFEFSCELLWKTIKVFLYEIEGVDVKTPKSAIKEFFNSGHIGYKEYELLIQMIDDRNKLGHIYKQEMFKEILRKIKNYLILMGKVLKVLQGKISQRKNEP